MVQTNCNVCEEQFTDSPGPRVPRILTECGHTMCEMCCITIIIDQTIQCPFDWIETTAPDGNVKMLKKNFSVIEAVEEDNWEKRMKNKSENDYSEERALNIRCDEDDSHVAVMHCQKCETNLCEICDRLTHSTKTLSTHRKIRLTKMKEVSCDDVQCPAHPYNLGDLYCKQPECTASTRVMCLTCHHCGEHKGHVFCNKGEECIRLKQQLVNAAVRFEKQISVLESVLNNASDVSASYTDADLEQKKTDINDRFTEIKKHLDDYQSRMIGKLEKEFSYLKIESDKKKRVVQNNLAKFTTIHSLVHSLLKLEKLDLSNNTIESVLFDCNQELTLPRNFMHSSSLRLRLPDLPICGNNAALGTQIVLYDMGDTPKSDKILHWLEKNSTLIRKDSISRSLTVIYKKQTVTLLSNNKSGDSYVSEDIKYLFLIDHYSNEQIWTDLFKKIEYSLEKDSSVKQCPVVLAINKHTHWFKNPVLESMVKSLIEKNANVSMMYYDHNFERNTIPLINYVLSL